MTLAQRLEPILDELVKSGVTLQQAMREIERQMIERARLVTKGNVTRAAQLLGVHRNTLMSKVPSANALRTRARQKRRRTNTRTSR